MSPTSLAKSQSPLHISDKFCLGFGLIVIAILTVGCSGTSIERVPVSGQVLLDGKPLAHGVLNVIPNGARPAFANLDSEGRFTLMTYKPGDGVPLGKHAVSVNAGEQIGVNAVRWHAPPKYAEHSKSGLSIDVVEETDTVVIDLTWDGGKPYVQSF